MTITEITNKMIGYSKGNFHDISHFLKVHTYAKTIGEQEGLNDIIQMIVEVAALLHDIACPVCRESMEVQRPSIKKQKV